MRRPERFVCSDCGREFHTYSMARMQACPHCGKQVRTHSARRLLRWLSAAALLAFLLLLFLAYRKLSRG